MENPYTSPDEAAGEELFGIPPSTPFVETPPSLIATEILNPGPAGWEPRPAAPLVDGTVIFGADVPGLPTASLYSGAETQGADGAAATPPALQGEPAADSLVAPRPPPRRPSERSTLVPMLLIFLIPYALTTTAFIVWQIYNQNKPVFDPLERLPDPKPGSGGAKRIHPLSPLPAKLKTSLHQSLRVGDLEVTPLDARTDAQGRLGLSLKLRNGSQDVAFGPVLPVEFYRFRPLGMVDTGPYTYLEVGDRRLYVLSTEWEKTPKRKNDELFDGMLQPGEELVAVFRTGPDDKGIIRAAEAARGALLWRVQLRRGLVAVQDTEVSATAVIGVEFGAPAIGKEQGIAALLSPVLRGDES